MSLNQTSKQPDYNESRVREFAYQIWESEGKPDGQAERHWDMACKLYEAQADDQANSHHSAAHEQHHLETQLDTHHALTQHLHSQPVSKQQLDNGQLTKPQRKSKAMDNAGGALAAKAHKATAAKTGKKGKGENVTLQ